MIFITKIHSCLFEKQSYAQNTQEYDLKVRFLRIAVSVQLFLKLHSFNMYPNQPPNPYGVPPGYPVQPPQPGYPPQTYPPPQPGYPPQTYPPTGYTPPPQPGYQPGYPPGYQQGYPPPGSVPPGFAPQPGYPPQAYPPQPAYSSV